MKILYFALFLAAVCLVMVGLDALIRKLAYDKSRRYLHGRLLLAVFLAELVLLNVYTISYPLLALDEVINSPLLAAFFDALLPHRAYALLYMLLAFLGLNIITVFVVLATVTVVKLLYIRRKDFVAYDELSLLERILHPSWFLVGRYYSEDSHSPYLNSTGCCAQIWVRGMKNVFLVLAGAEILLLAAAVLWGGDAFNETLRSASKAWYLLPFATYLVLEQFYLLLSGDSGEREVGSFFSAEPEEHLSGDMALLQKTYEAAFQDTGALLYSEAGASLDEIRRDSLGSDLDNQQAADCAEDNVLRYLCRQLHSCGVVQRDPFQDALGALLNGGSVAVRDQECGEFLFYLAAYLNYFLSQGRTGLLLCADAEQCGAVYEELVDRLSRLNSLHSVWCVRTAKDADLDQPMNLLVCTWSDLVRLHMPARYRGFFRDLFCVAVMDAASLFNRDRLHVDEIFGELEKVEQPLQYVIVSREDNENLCNTAAGVTKKELLRFSCDTRPRKTGIMVWKEESSYRLQHAIRVGSNDTARYLGTALPLALLGVKFDLPKVYLLSDPTRGDKTFSSRLSGIGDNLSHFLESDANVNTIIREDPREFMERQDLCMAIAYDTQYNLFASLWRWLKYGGSDGTLIHMIAPPYLLRDYFAANFKSRQLLMNSHEFDALVPCSMSLDTSHKAAILSSLCGGGLTTDELMARSRRCGWPYETVEELLRACLGVVVPQEQLHNIYSLLSFKTEKHFSPEENRFVQQTLVEVGSAGIREKLMDRVAYAALSIHGGERRPLDILRGNLSNYYLRDQKAVFDGYIYAIKSISDGCVSAELDDGDSLPQYFPVSSFVFADYTQTDPAVDLGAADMDLCTAHVERSIFGYWSSSRGNRFADGDLQYHLLGRQTDVTMDGVGILEFTFPRSAFGGRWQEAAALFAYMLRELSKTLFPNTWQNLFVVTDGCPDPELVSRVARDGCACPLEDVIRSCIPWAELKNWKAAPDEDQYVTVYALEFSCVEYGMVRALYDGGRNVFSLLREYLRWYLESSPSGDSYLHFGSETIPSLFAPKELFDALASLVKPVETMGEEKDIRVLIGQNRCSFCGRPAFFTYDAKDGRHICRDCKSHQLSVKDEVRALYADTVYYMNHIYGIRLRKNLHVRFQDADAIREAVGGSYNERVLGFYMHRGHQLWLESRGPELAMRGVLVHELTHSWQHDNLNLRALEKKLQREGKGELFLQILEGHAMYVEIDAMERQKYSEYAQRIRADLRIRDDEYGQGYRLVCDSICKREQEGSHMNAFTAMQRYVADILEGKEIL